MRSLGVGLLLAALAACGGEDTRPATWSYIYPAIVVPNCTTSSCHSSLTQTEGINFEDRAQAYSTFLGGSPRTLISGIDPNQWRMPPDQPLPQADIDLINRWYDEGALDN